MEKILSPEERVRRAQEIYERRRNLNGRRNIATVNVNEKKNFKILKKMFIQLLVCLLIYFIFYYINGLNNEGTNQFIEKTKDVLSYDINLEELFNNIQNWVNNFLKEDNKKIVSEQNVVNNENSIEQSQVESNTIEEHEVKEEESSNTEELSQEEKDAKYISENFNLIVPLNGIISSEYGERESTNEIITKEHHGIDIAAEEGSLISSAMEGEVIIARYSSSYGNFIEIQNNDVITVYAHCSSLLVTEGQYVGQDEIIATVGSTGAATGPHLHFEIGVEDRRINPRLVLEF